MWNSNLMMEINQPESLKMFLMEVKEEMTTIKINQRELGDRMGVCEQASSRLFSPRMKNIQIKTLEKIANALNMKLVICLMDK